MCGRKRAITTMMLTRMCLRIQNISKHVAAAVHVVTMQWLADTHTQQQEFQSHTSGRLDHGGNQQAGQKLLQALTDHSGMCTPECAR